MSAPSQPAFPSYIAFEDGALQIGINFRRELGANNQHVLTAVFKNKTSSQLDSVAI